VNCTHITTKGSEKVPQKNKKILKKQGFLLSTNIQILVNGALTPHTRECNGAEAIN
jgi:hypothetical protein